MLSWCCRYDKFYYDITDAIALRETGAEHEIIVTVYDPTEMAHIAIGKQRMRPPRHPSSIWYTSTTGQPSALSLPRASESA